MISEINVDNSVENLKFAGVAGKFHENLKSERVEFDRQNLKYVEVLEEDKAEYRVTQIKSSYFKQL